MATKQETPLELFDRAFAGSSGGELLEVWVRIVAEVAERLDTYLDAIEDGAPIELRNEAGVVATRAVDLAPLFAKDTRARDLAMRIRQAQRRLLSLAATDGAYA